MLARQVLLLLSYFTSHFFVMGFFKIGPHELFAQADFQTMILPISAPE
jgi:hypothetical protein